MIEITSEYLQQEQCLIFNIVFQLFNRMLKNTTILKNIMFYIRNHANEFNKQQLISTEENVYLLLLPINGAIMKIYIMIFVHIDSKRLILSGLNRKEGTSDSCTTHYQPITYTNMSLFTVVKVGSCESNLASVK